MKVIDGDSIRRDDQSYWACSLAIALRDRLTDREKIARENLNRLGLDLVPFRARRKKGANNEAQ